MRLFTFCSALMALSSCVASPTESERKDTIIVSTAMRRVSAGLKTLDRAFKSVPTLVPNPLEAVMFLLATDWEVLEEVRQSARDISFAPNIPDMEAIGMLNDFWDLPSLVNQVATNWITRKRLVQQVGKQQVVLKELQEGVQAMSNFSQALIGKLGPIPRTAGKMFTKNLIGYIEVAVSDYTRP